MLYYSIHKRFHSFCCNAEIVIVCHFVCNLMAFVCQEIKELLTYLLTYLFAAGSTSSIECFILQSHITN